MLDTVISPRCCDDCPWKWASMNLGDMEHWRESRVYLVLNSNIDGLSPE